VTGASDVIVEAAMFDFGGSPIPISPPIAQLCVRREAEILVLRQQLLVLNRQHPRVRLRNVDRLVLAWLYRAYPSRLNAIVVVKPGSVAMASPRAALGRRERLPATLTGDTEIGQSKPFLIQSKQRIAKTHPNCLRCPTRQCYRI
jgi:hypothetical protein